MPVYLIQAGDTDRVKIGYAIDVNGRISTLQSGHWLRLIWLKTWPGDKITEGWLHRHFDNFRIERDWFHFSPAMLEVQPPDLSSLRKPLSSDPDPILVQIEDFLVDQVMTPTAFGRGAANDPTLVYELRRGREIRKPTRKRIEEFMRSRLERAA